jgi:hypothetical protein
MGSFRELTGKVRRIFSAVETCVAEREGFEPSGTGVSPFQPEHSVLLVLYVQCSDWNIACRQKCAYMGGVHLSG